MSRITQFSRFMPRFWVSALFFTASVASIVISRAALDNSIENRRVADLALVQARPWYTERVARVDVVTFLVGPDPIMNQKQTLRVTYEDGTTFATDNMAMISVMILHMPRDRIFRTFTGRRT